MPVLNSPAALPSEIPIGSRSKRTFPACANPNCASGWFHLWRKRRVPVVEGGWVCSPACTRARVDELLRHEVAQANPASRHQHRIPIGLLLLTQGWITHEQLRRALKAQREGSGLRLGEWLMENGDLDEARLTQALALQWNCPIFRLEDRGNDLAVSVIPRLLSESLGFVPLSLTASGVLYLGFEDRIEHSITLSVERVTRLRVESGILSGTDYRRAREQVLRGHFPRTRMIEAGSMDLLAEAFTKHIEKKGPVESRLVRIRDLFWLRLWSRAEISGLIQLGDVEDVIGSVVRFS